ncbi:MAG TPA: rRNA maturation RNase YbeY [Cytophagaceae bacterium]
MKEEGSDLLQLNFIFCTDAYLLDINVQYLNHDYYTDIITFDNSSETDVLEGDIFISIDRITENAPTHNATFEEELLRVVVHGVLHLLGWSDKDDRSSQVMRNKETESINKFYNVPRGTLNKK